MRYPTDHEVAKLRGSERNFSKLYLGIQRGKERTSDCGTTFNVGCHYQIVAADAWDNDDFYLDFNVVTLVGSDIRPGMTLAVGTLTDPFLYGSARIRVVDAANQRLYLEPNNLNDEGYFVTGDYVYVDGVYRLYRILPYIEGGLIYEDGNADSLEPGAPSPDHGITWDDDYYDRPVALMGSPRFAWTGETIDFYGWRSHGRGGRTIQNWTWDFDGGICTGPGIGFPGSPASPIHARWNTAGEYVASLVVEDDSGNAGTDIYGVQFNRHRAVRPVLVYDRPGEGDNVPYSDFEIESLTGKYGSGWSARITVFGTADKSEFPDNALVILFAEDWYGGEQGSIGGWYGQEGILFCGYIRADSVEVDFEKSSVSFEAQTIEQWMKDISVWPVNFSDPVAAADEWHEFDDMTIEDCLWHLAEIHSTLKNVTDCFFASDVNAEKDVDFLDLTEASLYDQMSSQIGSCFFGQLSASRHGSVHLAKHKNMMDLGERAWWGPPVYSFSRQDWEGKLQVGEERQRDSVAQVDFVGFVYDAAGNPLESYSLAPERQTNFGGIEKVSGILLSGNTVGPGTPSQAESNTLAGLYRAWKNIRFPHIRVPTRINNRVLEPATLDYFAVVLDDTIRGYDWDGKEFLCTGVSVQTDNEEGKITVEVEGEASTWGPDGVAGPYPAGPPADDPPSDNPSEYWPDWPPGATPDNPDGDPPPWGEPGELDFPIVVYFGLVTGEVIRTTGVSPGIAGQRVQFHNCGQVHADGIYWMALDEFDPENTAMVCTGSRIHKTTNLSADTPDWDVVLTIGAEPATEMNMVRSSSVQQDLWMVIGYGATQIVVWTSTTGGTSWAAENFTSGNADGAYQVFLEMSSHDADVAWAMWIEVSNGRTYVGATDDRFVTQTLTFIPTTCFDNASTFRPCCHHRSYENDDDAERIYGGTVVGGATDYARIYRSPDCATLYTDGTASTIAWVPMVGCGISTRNRWWAIARGLNEQGFWISNDGIAWLEVYDWDFEAPGRWARDCKNLRGNWQWYLAGMDGTSYPLTLSVNRGGVWYIQPGGVGGGLGWAAFLTAEGLGNPDVIVVCPVEAPR